MPRYVIQTPGGKRLTIDAADPATAMQGAQGWAAQNEGVGAARKDVSPPLPSWAVPWETFANNATLGLSDVLGPAMAAGSTAVKNMVTRAQGGAPAYSAGDRYAAERQQEIQQEQQYAAQHPVGNVINTLGGAAATPGLGEAGAAIRQAGGLGGRILRSAVAMGSAGAVQGAAAAPDVQHMGSGSAVGGAVGAGLGAAAPVVGAVAAPVVNTAVRVVNKATGGRLIPPAQTAMSQAAKYLTPADLNTSTGAWQGATPPTVLDVGGENFAAKVRAAAAQPGDARQAAQNYLDQTTANFQPNVIAVARRAAPDAPTAQAATDFANGTRQAQADAAYSAARADPISLSSTGKTALQDTPGQDAIDQAYSNAAVNRDDATMAELQLLRSGATSRPVSAGTVHALSQAMNELGTKAQNFGNNYAAKGYFSRAGDLMSDLTDQSPGYAQANSDYAANSRVIDAIPAGRDVINAAKAPVEYASQISGMSPAETAAAQVGGVQSLTDAFGAPAENATGVVNRVATGTNVGQNLEALYGADAADYLRSGLSDEMARLSNARFVSPNTGSQTATRASDSGHFGLPNIMGFIKSATANTPAENAALFQIATSDPSDIAAQMMARPKPPVISTPAAYYLSQAANGAIGASTSPDQ